MTLDMTQENAKRACIMTSYKPDARRSVISWLSLGTNRGEMVLNLTRAALDISVLPGSSLHAVSSIYETAPVGEGYSGPFLNAVLGLRTQLEPEELLHHCQRIETSHGRDRNTGDRTLDIDILLYGDDQLQNERLTIPHPEMHRRRFVLEPLCEVAESPIHPVLVTPLCELLSSDEIRQQQVTRLPQPIMPAWGC